MPRDGTLFVSGANGFIGSQIVADLVAQGRPVRGSVRSQANADSIAHLQPMLATGNLELCDAELTQANAFHGLLEGCTSAIHTASPYVVSVEDPQRDLVDPAVLGTLNMLNACAETPSVERVVLTSSMAAITDEPDVNQVLTEENWNTKSSLSRNPYYYSKTVAERAAWDWMRENKPNFDLVVINPFFVIGPSLTPTLNQSNRTFVDIRKGVYPGIASLAWGLTDVRDVAMAHWLAVDTPSAAGRYICAGEVATMRQVCNLMRTMGLGEGNKIPTIGLDNPVGTWIAKLASYMQPKGIGSYLRTHLGKTPNFSTEKIRRDLNMQFRPLETTLKDTFEDLTRWGHW